MIGGREIDTSKDLYTINDIDELRDYLNALFREMSKLHPDYPEYGYTYEDGKIIECRLKGGFMIVDVPTKIIPIWFIEKWKKENAEPSSALDVFIEKLIKDWELEESRQSK